MANITPRIAALGTVGLAATIAVASGAFAAFFPTQQSGMNCSGYGYHAGYGYGYDCVPASSGSSGGGGGGGSASGTPVTITANTDPKTPSTTPSVVIFKDFTKKCEQAVKDLTDSRLTAYYDVLKVIDRSNMNRSLTRAEFLKLVLNSAKVDVSNESAPAYEDVPSTHTLANYVAYATRVGMVSGQNGKFRPNDTITRAEAAKVFVNAAGIGLSSEMKTFSDVAPESSLAVYIQTAFDNCLLNGRQTQGGESTRADGKRVYEPNSNITLAETAKVLYNIVH